MKLTPAKPASLQNLVDLMWSHASEIKRFIQRRLPCTIQSVTSADDILQETYRVAFRDLSRFEEREGSSLLMWLKSVAINRLLDAVKHHQRKKRGGGFHRIKQTASDVVSTNADVIDVVACDTMTPERQLIRKELIQTVRGEMASLPRPYRQALSLQFVEKLTYSEIGERMGRSPTAVQGLIKRGKAQLRSRLDRLDLNDSRLQMV